MRGRPPRERPARRSWRAGCGRSAFLDGARLRPPPSWAAFELPQPPPPSVPSACHLARAPPPRQSSRSQRRPASRAEPSPAPTPSHAGRADLPAGSEASRSRLSRVLLRSGAAGRCGEPAPSPSRSPPRRDKPGAGKNPPRRSARLAPERCPASAGLLRAPPAGRRGRRSAGHGRRRCLRGGRGGGGPPPSPPPLAAPAARTEPSPAQPSPARRAALAPLARMQRLAAAAAAECLLGLGGEAEGWLSAGLPPLPAGGAPPLLQCRPAGPERARRRSWAAAAAAAAPAPRGPARTERGGAGAPFTLQPPKLPATFSA